MFITTIGGGMLASSVVGGLLGGSDSGSSSSQTKELDPRIAKYVFGADGTSGLLGDASGLYGQQMATGGLNDLQRQGLGMQTQYLTSPQYQQGYQQMYDTGISLMGGGVAGNPYTSGQRTLGQRPGRQMTSGGMQQRSPMMGGQQVYGQMSNGPTMTPYGGQQGFQYQPIQAAATPDYSRKEPVAQPATQLTDAEFEKLYLAYLQRLGVTDNRFGSGDGFGGGFGGAASGSDGSDGPSGEA
jgi:hypothetical protein